MEMSVMVVIAGGRSMPFDLEMSVMEVIAGGACCDIWKCLLWQFLGRSLPFLKRPLLQLLFYSF